MRDENKNNSLGKSIAESIRETGWFLTILFCALRACNVISWSWFWIMFPIFCTWAIGIGAAAFLGIVAAAAYREGGDSDD